MRRLGINFERLLGKSKVLINAQIDSVMPTTLPTSPQTQYKRPVLENSNKPPISSDSKGLASFGFSDWLVMGLVAATLIFLGTRLYSRWSHAKVHFSVNPIHIHTDLSAGLDAKSPLKKIVSTLQMNESATPDPATIEKISAQIQKAKGETTPPIVVADPTNSAPTNATLVWWQGLELEWKQIFKKNLNKKTELMPSDLNEILNMQSLDCSKIRGSKTVLKSLAPLKQLTKLKSIDFSNTEVSDLSALAEMKLLESIDCRGTKVNNLQALKGLENIKFIDCSNTAVSDISPLANSAPRLQKVVLAETKVSNLLPLAYAKSLRHLDISGTRVSSLEPIKGLSDINVLMLSYSEIDNLSSILTWSALQELTLKGINLKNAELDALKSKNPSCKITK